MTEKDIKQIIKETIDEYNKSVVVNLKSAETREFIKELVNDVLTNFREKECPIPTDKTWRGAFSTIDPNEFTESYSFLRDWKNVTSHVKKYTIKTIVSVIVAGTLGLIWLALNR